MHIKVTVFPDSARDHIEKVSEDSYRVFVEAPPKDNLANKAVILLLSKHFGKGVKLISGGMKTHKIFEIF